jgi:hypothetical protein
VFRCFVVALALTLLVAVPSSLAVRSGNGQAAQPKLTLCGPATRPVHSTPAFAFTLNRRANGDDPGPFSLYVASLDGSDVWRIGHKMNSAIAPSDGARLVTFLHKGAFGYSTSLAVIGLRRRCREELGREFASSAAWAPDGRSVAFEDKGGVYVADDRGRLSRVSQPGQSPRWSGDGRRLAYIVRDSGGDPDLWIMNADGSGQRRQLAPMGFYCRPQPQWLRDNDHIVFCGKEDALSVVSVKTHKIRRIWRTFRAEEIKRSPKDDTIAAISAYDLGQALYLIEPSQHHAPRLIAGGPVAAAAGPGDAPAWSGDGRYILFEKHGQIWMIKRDGTGLKKLTRCAYHGGECMQPEWLAQQPTGFPLVTWSQVN